MPDQIPFSRRLEILLSGIWLSVTAIFSAVGATEFFNEFNILSSFLLTWFFSGVVPLGLVWGVGWVISGYRSRHQETERGIWRFDYRKGLRRLWIVGTAIWFVHALVGSGNQVGEWMGFHYSLLREAGSFELAAARKQKYVALNEACNTADRATCWTNEPDPRFSFFGWERRPGCERTQAFRDVLTHELRVRGIEPTTSGALGESCPDVMAKGVPIFNLVGFFSTILAPFVVLVVYWIVRWVVRGFARER